VKLLRPAAADLQYKVGNGTFKPVVGNVITLSEIKDMPVSQASGVVSLQGIIRALEEVFVSEHLIFITLSLERHKQQLQRQ
jgi:hypothetical protein